MNIGFCLYHYKPLGTQPEEYEYALYHCYRPLLTYLYTKQNVKLTLFLSGSIFEWLEDTYPEINMLISDLMKRGQLELLGGGYYAPAFPLIPIKDRSMQVELLNTFLRKRFGKKPRGALMTDQQWQPNFITTLNSCDLSYVVIFDPDEKNRHKRSQGWYEPFTMIDVGRGITIVPASGRISSMIPSRRPDEVASEISEAVQVTESEQLSLMVSADDLITGFMLSDIGSMIEYVDDLFALLGQYDFKSSLLSDIVQTSSLRLDYLSAGWHHPMRFNIPGSDAHDMLKRYPEGFHSYCKMYYLQRLINGIKKDKSRKKSADAEVLKAQSSSYFWCGTGGGIYRNNLRKEQHRNLIEAEKMTREKGVFTTSLNSYDLDFDGMDEYIYRGKNITVMIDRRGGSLREIDYLVTSWNYQDTFSGSSQDGCMVSPPIYPPQIAQNSFNDLFFTEPTDHIADKYRSEVCRNLELECYDLLQYSKDAKVIAFSRDEDFELSGRRMQISLEKRYQFQTNSIELLYTITNRGDEPISFYFCSEINLSFGYDGIEFIEMASIDSSQAKPMSVGESLPNVRYLKIHDINNNTHIGIYAKQRFYVMNATYSTVINTTYGEEEIYQHSVYRPFWKIELAPGEQWNNTVGLRIEKRTTNRRKKI